MLYKEYSDITFIKLKTFNGLAGASVTDETSPSVGEIMLDVEVAIFAIAALSLLLDELSGRPR